MTDACRTWWRNCALEADTEIIEIDGMEDRIAPLSPEITAVRELISSFELCHHKAERWIENIADAIGAGKTRKGLGTRPADRGHPTVRVWRNACAALSAWCAGRTDETSDLTVGAIPAPRLLDGLGTRSPLKEWQVRRVIEKIGSVIDWQQPPNDPAEQYGWILLGGGDYESAYRDNCPEKYREQEEFWLKTVRTTIRDRFNGDQARLSLGLAIDMLWPCHWRFVDNLEIVLDAIGGKLDPESPFAACGRNIGLYPNRSRMETVSRTLKAFTESQEKSEDVNNDLLARLGDATNTKKWLAASLDKTIRLQLDPPDDLRAASSLAGPDWWSLP